MRTTIEFNNFTFKQVKQLQAKTGKPLSMTINELVQKALKAEQDATYYDFRTKVKKLGTIPSLDYSNTHELLERAEGKQYK